MPESWSENLAGFLSSIQGGSLEFAGSRGPISGQDGLVPGLTQPYCATSSPSVKWVGWRIRGKYPFPHEGKGHKHPGSITRVRYFFLSLNLLICKSRAKELAQRVILFYR